MKKIMYFTAGEQATQNERNAITALNVSAEAPYVVAVRRGDGDTNYGAGPEDCDYVAGTVPDKVPYNAKPVYDPANPPAPTLPATQTVVKNNDVLNVTGGGTVKLTVAGNAVTGVAYTAP